MDGPGRLCQRHMALWCFYSEHVRSLEYGGAVGRMWYGSYSQNGAVGRWTSLRRHRDPGEYSAWAVPNSLLP